MIGARRSVRACAFGLAALAFAAGAHAAGAPPAERPIAADQLDAQGAPLHLGKGVFAKGASLHSVEWPVHDIAVCWLNPAPEDEAGRATVRAAVHDAWETAANLRLTGWAACRGHETAVRIVVSDDEWPRAMVGTQALSRSRPTVFLNFHLARQPSFANCLTIQDRCLRFTAVHEFGHMLGLIHEQDRPDTPADCINKLASGQRQERHDRDLDLLTGYDPDSLMNYCSVRGYNPNVPLALSDEDRVSIVKLFGAFVAGAPTGQPVAVVPVPRGGAAAGMAAAPAAGTAPAPGNTDPPPAPRHPDRPVFDPN
jgi:hypothetical protein